MNDNMKQERDETNVRTLEQRELTREEKFAVVVATNAFFDVLGPGLNGRQLVSVGLSILTTSIFSRSRNFAEVELLRAGVIRNITTSTSERNYRSWAEAEGDSSDD